MPGNPHEIHKYASGATTPTKYFYVLNLQGDVIQLRDTSNAVVANYTYDVWGKLLSVTNASGAAITDATHIANVNPIRYRGYFYDTETKLYYCNSRYYDPQIKRFINADVLLDTGTGFLGYNMFAYCENNPVMYSDPSGYIRASGYVNGVWCSNPDEYEFGSDSDTYLIILDLTDRWWASSSKSERDRIHMMAENVRLMDRSGTPYMYGNDKVWTTLHNNRDLGASKQEYSFLDFLLMRTITDVYLESYTWFVNMTCSDWNYKYNSSWQVPYSYFNGQNMNANNAKNWAPWIYFEGDIMGADKFGNLNLGYVGVCMGFDGIMLDNFLTNDKGDGKYVRWGMSLAKAGR